MPFPAFDLAGDPAKVEALDKLAARSSTVSQVALCDLLQTSDVNSKLEIPHLENDEIKNVVRLLWDSKKEQKAETIEERRFRLDKAISWIVLGGTIFGAILGAHFG